ncbi:hypothetical protein VB715_21090 [Crocosphaera sp. UHCC 0190]|uniref:hypothetical protein n=1 Tax=Crocosphaera sp. UHCC 0190 TaxID=3110246 RepID=UPI002B1F595E|nr:hypothetical protein [Crocosphaera sp. UHCC 0190]MEA5512271.1 hypothetical protein [Crocosphaera sp. UHCC 0190]
MIIIDLEYRETITKNIELIKGGISYSTVSTKGFAQGTRLSIVLLDAFSVAIILLDGRSFSQSYSSSTSIAQ